MFDELIRFLVGGETVIAGLGDLDVRGHKPPLEQGDELVQILDQRHRVGARLLGHRQGHCRGVDRGPVDALFVRRRPRTHPHVGARLFGPVEDPCHVLEVDRTGVVDPYNDVTDLIGVAQEGTHIHLVLLIEGHGDTGRQTPVKAADGLIGLQNRDVERGQAVAVEIDPNHPSLAAEHPHLSDPRMPGQLDPELVGDPPQFQRGGVLAPQGVGGGRHVVDRARLDDRWHHPVGHLVQRRLDLGVNPNHRLVGVGPDHEADDDHAAGGLRGGVDVVDVFDFIQQLLEWRDDSVLHLLGGGARETDHDVDHRHLDLRFLLTGE